MSDLHQSCSKEFGFALFLFVVFQRGTIHPRTTHFDFDRLRTSSFERKEKPVILPWTHSKTQTHISPSTTFDAQICLTHWQQNCCSLQSKQPKVGMFVVKKSTYQRQGRMTILICVGFGMGFVHNNDKGRHKGNRFSLRGLKCVFNPLQTRKFSFLFRPPPCQTPRSF